MQGTQQRPLMVAMWHTESDPVKFCVYFFNALCEWLFIEIEEYLVTPAL